MKAWTDIETTGLMAPKDGRIMEVACIMTTDDFVELGRISVVHRGRGFEDIWGCIDPYVCKMHANNGLYAEVVAKQQEATWQLTKQLTEWWDALVEKHSSYEGGDFDFSEVQMAGNTIHFDRAWLKHWCPEFEAKFNYRNFDMSTMNQAVRAWAPGLLSEDVMSGVPGTETHRAMDDAENSMNLGKVYAPMFKFLEANYMLDSRASSLDPYARIMNDPHYVGRNY